MEQQRQGRRRLLQECANIDIRLDLKYLQNWLCKCFVRKEMLSTRRLQSMLVSSTECKHNFCLFTRKLSQIQWIVYGISPPNVIFSRNRSYKSGCSCS